MSCGDGIRVSTAEEHRDLGDYLHSLVDKQLFHDGAKSLTSAKLQSNQLSDVTHLDVTHLDVTFKHTRINSTPATEVSRITRCILNNAHNKNNDSLIFPGRPSSETELLDQQNTFTRQPGSSADNIITRDQVQPVDQTFDDVIQHCQEYLQSRGCESGQNKPLKFSTELTFLDDRTDNSPNVLQNSQFFLLLPAVSQRAALYRHEELKDNFNKLQQRSNFLVLKQFSQTNTQLRPLLEKHQKEKQNKAEKSLYRNGRIKLYQNDCQDSLHYDAELNFEKRNRSFQTHPQGQTKLESGNKKGRNSYLQLREKDSKMFGEIVTSEPESLSTNYNCQSLWVKSNAENGLHDKTLMDKCSSMFTTSASFSGVSNVAAIDRSANGVFDYIFDDTNSTENESLKNEIEYENSAKRDDNYNLANVEFNQREQSISFTHRWLNFVLAYFLVGPLVTVYWCNSWHLPENYVFPADARTSAWISGAVGFTVYFLAYFLQDDLASFLIRQNKVVQGIFMQVYSYIMCWGNVNQWRCVWILLDEYTGTFLLNAALSCALASALMLVMRVHRTIAACPSTIRMDLPASEHFKLMTFFELELSSSRWCRAADSLFTVIVVDTIGIAVWRGVWEVMDFALMPEDKTMSGVWSVVISYGLAILLFLTQGPVKRISIALEDKHWLISLLFEDMLTLLHSTVTICHWRGFWTLMDVYLPYKPISHWVCHLASFTLLAIGLVATSIPVFGCAKEGRLAKGKGIVFDHYYFSRLQELWNLGKANKNANDKDRRKNGGELHGVTMNTMDDANL